MSATGQRTPSGHHRPWLGAIRMFAAELLLVPTGLVTAGVLTRQLGSAVYGEYVLAIAAVAWVQYTATALLARATNRVVAAADDWRPLAAEILRLYAYIGVGAALLVATAAPLMASLLHQPTVTSLLRWLSLDVLFAVFAAGYRSVLVSMGEHAWLSALSALRWLVRMAAVVGFVLAGWSAQGAVAGIVVSSAVFFAASAVRVGWLPRASAEHRRAIRESVFSVAAPTALATIALRLFERGDVILLSALGAESTTLGEYGAAQNLTLILAMLGTTIAPVLLSTVTRHRQQGDLAASARIVGDALRIPLLVLPFAAIGAGAARDIMSLVYGEAMAGGALPFALLALGGCALVSFAVTSALLIAADRAWWVMSIAVPMVALLAVLGTLWHPPYGAEGVALASVVLSVLAAAVARVAVARTPLLGNTVRSEWTNAAVCLAIALAAGLAAHLWPAADSFGRVAKLAMLSVGVAAALVATGQVKVRGGVRLS